MTSPIYPVFEGDGGTHSPKWPDENDMGGLQFVDDPQYPPVHQKRLSATDYMQLEMCVARACRMVPALVFDFQPGNTPNTPAVLAHWSVVDDLEFTINRTGTGLYTVAWDQTLPPLVALPTIRGIGNYLVLGGLVTVSGQAAYLTCYATNSTPTPSDDPLYRYRVSVYGAS